MPLTTAVETITKPIAQMLIESQDVNRPVSWPTVRRYSNDMNAGLWDTNGESIKIDHQGHMRDGAHRCHALLISDIDSFDSVVVRGLEPITQRTMDLGRRRSPGNQLAMMGIKNANVVAGGAKLYLLYTTGLMFRDNNVATEHITTTFIEKWAGENIAKIDRLNGYLTDILATDAQPSVAYAAALVFDECGPTAAPAFFRLLHKGAGDESHPITVLDKRLQRHRRESIKIAPREVLGFYIQSWNAWAKDRPLTKFQRPRGGHWTEATFPRPVRVVGA